LPANISLKKGRRKKKRRGGKVWVVDTEREGKGGKKRVHKGYESPGLTLQNKRKGEGGKTVKREKEKTRTFFGRLSLRKRENAFPASKKKKDQGERGGAGVPPRGRKGGGGETGLRVRRGKKEKRRDGGRIQAITWKGYLRKRKGGGEERYKESHSFFYRRQRKREKIGWWGGERRGDITRSASFTS